MSCDIACDIVFQIASGTTSYRTHWTIQNDHRMRYRTCVALARHMRYRMRWPRIACDIAFRIASRPIYIACDLAKIVAYRMRYRRFLMRCRFHRMRYRMRWSQKRCDIACMHNNLYVVAISYAEVAISHAMSHVQPSYRTFFLYFWVPYMRHRMLYRYLSIRYGNDI